MPDNKETSQNQQTQSQGADFSQALEELKTAPISAAALVKWFEGRLTDAQKAALESTPDVHEHLIPEKDIKSLEGKVKDSLVKQKEKLKSEFNNLLTQVNLKDPEAAQKLFPAEIRKLINDNPEFAKDFEKANKEAEKQAVAGAADEKLKKQMALSCLLLYGPKDDKWMEQNLEDLLKWCGVDDVKTAARELKGWVGPGAITLKQDLHDFPNAVRSWLENSKDQSDPKKWAAYVKNSIQGKYKNAKSNEDDEFSIADQLALFSNSYERFPADFIGTLKAMKDKRGDQEAVGEVTKNMLSGEDQETKNESYEGEPESNPFQVGDILAGTYSYRINVPHFVQVISVTPKSVKCRRLVGQGMNGMYGDTAYAEADVFDDSPAWTARVKYSGSGRAHVYHDQVLYGLWDGKPMSYDYLD